MRFRNPSSKDLPKEDLDFVCSFDLFHFAMTAERINSRSFGYMQLILMTDHSAQSDLET
jgi:hypothetical protein